MLRKGFLFRSLLALAVCTVAPACTKSNSNDSNSGDSGGGSDNSGDFRSDCGTVIEGMLQNPVSKGDGSFGSVRAVGANLVIVHLGNGDQLVKLQGIGDAQFNFQKQGAINRINALTSGGAYLFPAGATCQVTVSGGGQGVVGQIFTTSGVNVSEQLLKEGLAVVESNDNCGGNLLDGCYSALLDNKGMVGGVVSKFLWKPVSDSNGKLVVTFSPFAASVVVQGESLISVGAGNGRDSTFRGSRPGCSYGKNVHVEIKDADGNRIVAPDGNDVIVPDGCQRFEIQ